MYFFTAQAVSPGISAAEVWTSLISLGVLYGVLAVIEFGLIVRFARAGVTEGDTTPTPGIGGGSSHRDGDEPPRADDDASDDVLQFAY